MRFVVCDTGPLLHLGEAGVLALLERTGHVHLPSAVAAEVAAHDSTWRDRWPPWLVLVPLEPPYAEEAIAWTHAGILGAGEAEAIALVRQTKADWLLTDDAAARLIAVSLGIEVHGSLGVVLWAAAAGHVDRTQAEMALTALAASSFWISARVLSEARAALSRLFS